MNAQEQRRFDFAMRLWIEENYPLASVDLAVALFQAANQGKDFIMKHQPLTVEEVKPR